MTHPIKIFSDLDAFAAQGDPLIGPIAVLLAEDDIEVASTFSHLVSRGFATIVVMGPTDIPLPESGGAQVIRTRWINSGLQSAARAVNAVIGRAAGQWIHYCYNAEYVFYPFCETRRIDEMLAFHTEERRDAMLTFTVDLYTGAEDGPVVSLTDAHLDASGYYATDRRATDGSGHHLDRQLDFFGGLRWRFEEHVPANRRRIDRVSIFRARDGLILRANHTFNDPEYNTYSCPWHHNLTAAVCSFRAAKALRTNAGSRYEIGSFLWMKSEPFTWESRQLMDLGLMEPGQWF